MQNNMKICAIEFKYEVDVTAELTLVEDVESVLRNHRRSLYPVVLVSVKNPTDRLRVWS